MRFNYSALRGRIVEKYGTTTSFAKAIGMSRSSLSQKLNNKTQWQQDEIETSRVALDLKVSDLTKYFFTKEVQ